MSDNPLLAKVQLPGKVFQLPSRGFFYKNNELAPNVVAGEIQVHPMTALDEIYMKNPDMLFSGKAVETVFRTCVSEVTKPNDLLNADVEAIQLFLRAITYGDKYEILSTHDCENAKEHQYTVSVEQLINQIKYLDPTTAAEQFTVNLENGQVVHLQPLRFKHVIALLTDNQHKKQLTAEDMKTNLITTLLNVIHDVDGVTEPKLIMEWISEIPVGYVNKLASQVESSSVWGVDSLYTIKCTDCQSNYGVEVPLNPISFFTE